MATIDTVSTGKDQKHHFREVKIGQDGFTTGTITGTTAKLVSELDADEQAVVHTLNAGDEIIKGIKVTLVAGGGPGGVLISWQNPENTSIYVTGLNILISVGATGPATGDFGIAATSVTSDNLIDGLDLAVTGNFSSHSDPGSNGAPGGLLVLSTDYVTGFATGDTTNLEGFAFIQYMRSV